MFLVHMQGKGLGSEKVRRPEIYYLVWVFCSDIE